MDTKTRLYRVALVLDTINEVRRESPNAGRFLERAVLSEELKDLELATTIQDVDERLDAIPQIDDPAQ